MLISLLKFRTNAKKFSIAEISSICWTMRKRVSDLSCFSPLLAFFNHLLFLVLKWHERAISRPEVSRYSIPCFESKFLFNK